MKMFLISFVIACALCLPTLAELVDWAMPHSFFLSIPATGLGYMLVFFHEIGHTAAFWAFGSPAIPQFDFAHGGGYTHAMNRMWFILIAIWGAALLAAVWLWRHMEYRWLIWLGVLMALHTALLMTQGHEIFICFAGHGAEVLVGAFCLLRAFWNTTEKSHGAVERWLNMIFGCFAMIYSAIFTAGLIFSDISRDVYAGQKGGHLEGDLDRIAEITAVTLPVVAGILLTFNIAVFAYAIYMGMRHAPDRSIRTIDI